jgi:hypothetical protein
LAEAEVNLLLVGLSIDALGNLFLEWVRYISSIGLCAEHNEQCAFGSLSMEYLSCYGVEKKKKKIEDISGRSAIKMPKKIIVFG